jgi:Protein of unknown function (DUF1761)
MQHVHHMLNFWAILVTAVIFWFFGAIWFSPLLFAKPWAAMVGRPMGEKPKGVVHGMISSFIGNLLLALVLDHIIIWSSSSSFGHGALVGFICWLGFIAGLVYSHRIYEGRPFGYFAIVGGYWLIGCSLTGGILAIWR